MSLMLLFLLDQATRRSNSNATKFYHVFASYYFDVMFSTDVSENATSHVEFPAKDQGIDPFL